MYLTPAHPSHRQAPHRGARRRLAALAAGWFFLAPPALGGATPYVVTNGVSMHPRIHTGDLALVRPAGDVPRRRHRRLPQPHAARHRAAPHRRGHPHGYMFKGDNNTWRDPEHVTRAQIIGKLWVLAPTLGMRMAQVRSPVVMATLAAIAVVLLFGGAGVHRSRRRRRRGPEPKWRPSSPSGCRSSPATQSGAIGSSGAVAVAAIALAVCAGIALSPGRRPRGARVPEHVGYRQSGAFAYAATTIPGAVYGRATRPPASRCSRGWPAPCRRSSPTRCTAAPSAASRGPRRHGHRAGVAERVVADGAAGGPTPFAGRTSPSTGIVHLRRLRAAARAGRRRDRGAERDVHGHPRRRRPGARQDGRARVRGRLLAPAPVHADAVRARAGAAGRCRWRRAARAGSAGVFHPGADGRSFAAAGSQQVTIGPARLHLRSPSRASSAWSACSSRLVAVALAVICLLPRRRADEPTRIRPATARR